MLSDVFNEVVFTGNSTGWVMLCMVSGMVIVAEILSDKETLENLIILFDAGSVLAPFATSEI